MTGRRGAGGQSHGAVSGVMFAPVQCSTVLFYDGFIWDLVAGPINGAILFRQIFCYGRADLFIRLLFLFTIIQIIESSCCGCAASSVTDDSGVGS